MAVSLKFLTRPFVVAALACLLVLQGCGGGGGGGGSSPEPLSSGGGEDEGSLLIGITDAEGDFVTYTVDVTAMQLHRANGDVVSALPRSTRIDFAELTEVTEFLTVATVPAGNYQSVTLSLDYQNAEILVQDDMGNAVAPTLLDEQGNPLTTADVQLMLEGTEIIRIAPGRPAAFSLDFDLDASNDIDFGAAPPTLTVEPFLLAAAELEADRAHRARGVLEEVLLDSSEFVLKVRPFRHRDGDFGRLTIATDDVTEYEIDGEAYLGQAGLTALAALPENTPVTSGVQVTDEGLLAISVLAGTSVPGTDRDIVRGVVSARNGDSLTVIGARVDFVDGTSVFRGEYTIELGDDTTVVEPRLDEAFTIDSISVGQRVIASGEQIDDVTMDATAGRVRMLLNQLTAEVVQAAPLAVDFYHLNGRKPAAFDFSGTGLTAGEDADPDFYEIDTSVLDISAVSNGDLLRIRGLVNVFGAAPADYNATTIVDVATDRRPAALKVGWDGGTLQPFLTTAAERVELDLSEARLVLKQRGVPMAFNEPIEMLALIAPAENGIYAVKVRGDSPEVHTYRGFADLVDELVAQLDAGRALHRITAHGKYNKDTAELTTGRASFVFADPEGATE